MEKICVLLSRFFPRWTLECPSPMCFSTTAPEPSSPSETRICMVVLCAPPSCVVPVLLLLHCWLTSSAFCLIVCVCVCVCVVVLRKNWTQTLLSDFLRNDWRSPNYSNVGIQCMQLQLFSAFRSGPPQFGLVHL